MHALVGENGAGKSTLMKTLYGMHRPDEGEILVDGEPRRGSARRRDAIAAGIGMVHQHFMLAENLTVLENVVLGSEPRRGVLLDAGAAERDRARCRERYGLDARARPLVEDSRVGERQRVEIAKVLFRGARMLILDEPTAVLVPQEVDELFGNLAELRREGLSVIFISHKLDEVLRVADAITVIRRGTTVATVDAGRDDAAAARASSWSAASCRCRETRESTVTDDVELSARRRHARAAGRPRAAARHRRRRSTAARSRASPASRATARASWSRRSSGLRPPTPGTVHLGDEDITALAVMRRREAGIAYVPEDRHRQGLLLAAPLWENRVLGHQTLAAALAARLDPPPGARARHRADHGGVRRPRAGRRRRWPARCPAATSRS